jgi:hypothetical protein
LAWARQNILPLLSWKRDREQAMQAWHGFLSRGRWIEGLLSDFLPLYIETFDHINELDSVADNFCNHMASLALFASINPLDKKNGWLIILLWKLDQDKLESWAKHIKRHLESIENDERIVKIWNRWLKTYWENRINGVLPPLEIAEMQVMIEWSISLKPVFSEVVSLICKRSRCNFSNSHFFKQLIEKRFHESNPNETAELLRYILQNRDTYVVYWEPIIELFESLRNVGIKKEICLAIYEQLARLGYSISDDLSVIC